MNANANAIANSSYNLTNASNRGFNRREANKVQVNNPLKTPLNVSEDNDMDIAKDISQMVIYQKGFEANIPVIKTENDVQNSILDIKA